MLKAEHVCVQLGGRQILSDVSLSLQPGEWLMLAGPNGAGKSTLLGALTGVIPFDGCVTLEDRDIREMKPVERARRMGVLRQINTFAADFTVEEVVAMGRYAYRQGILSAPETDARERVAEALRTVGMTELRQRRILSLSGGERQRMLLAQVLCQDPAILVLDEPANHLDMQYQRQLLLTVDAWRKAGDRAVISVLHDLSMARRWGTHALLLRDGCCAASGTATEVLTPENLTQTYRMDVVGWLDELHSAWSDR